MSSNIDYVDADPDSDQYLQRTIHCPECGKVCPIDDDVCNECGNYLDISIVEEELESRVRIDEYEEDPETGDLVLIIDDNEEDYDDEPTDEELERYQEEYEDDED